MKNILITGGAGFIGSEIVDKLYNNSEYNTTVIDIMSPQIHGNDFHNSFLYNKIKNKCNFVNADICDINMLLPLVEKSDCIIHLCAETGTGQSMYQINQYNNTNIMGTSNILQAISLLKNKNNVKKIILSSSRSVYGEGRYKCPNCGIVYPKSRRKEDMLAGDFSVHCPKCNEKLELMTTTEDSAIMPASLYAYTKYSEELMLTTMCPSMGLDYVIFRFQNVYGVGQSLKNPYTGILSIFSSLMLENKAINIFEDGKESRDFINVKDIATYVIASIDNDKVNNNVINLGSGIGTTVNEITEILKVAYNSKSEIKITGDFRLGDIAHNVADIKKAEELLGFKTTVNLTDGLKEFCDWVKTQSFDNSKYEKSLVEMKDVGMFIKKI